MSDSDSIPLSAVAGGTGGAVVGALTADATGEPWLGPVLALGSGVVVAGAVLVVHDKALENSEP